MLGIQRGLFGLKRKFAQLKKKKGVKCSWYCLMWRKAILCFPFDIGKDSKAIHFIGFRQL